MLILKLVLVKLCNFSDKRTIFSDTPRGGKCYSEGGKRCSKKASKMNFIRLECFKRRSFRKGSAVSFFLGELRNALLA